MEARAAWKVGAIGCVALVVFLWFLVLLPRGTPITEDAAKVIQAGMTHQQVKDILGPERDETRGRVIWLLPPRTKYNPRTTEDRHWVSKRAAITVGFDRKTGRAVDVWCERPFLWDPSWCDRVEEWVRDHLAP